MTAGIYKIENKVSGKVYIGSASNFARRWREHRSHLNRGVHCNSKLQRAWTKYSPEAFTFNILLQCAVSDLVFFEQRAVDAFQSIKTGYNILPPDVSSLGFRHREETKAKLSKAHKGKVLTLEHRAAIAAGNTGKKMSPESIAKMRGRKCSPEVRARMSGRVKSEEELTKMRIAATARKTHEEYSDGSRKGWVTRRANQASNADSARSM